MDNVHRIMSSQSDLKQACDTIEAYQAELDADLAALSENLDLELEALQLQVGDLVCFCFPDVDIFVFCMPLLFEFCFPTVTH